MALVQGEARAEHIVAQAFAAVLTAPGHEHETESKLCVAARRLATRDARGPAIQALPPSDLRVSRDLHLRILDAIEDRQYTSRPGRSRLVALGAVTLMIAVAGIVQVQRTRSAALAASVPTVTKLVPAAGATEVPVAGEFRILFGRRPVGTPTLQHLPPDGTQAAAHWDGSTLRVDYVGLRFGVRYQLILQADYRSRLRDPGHFEKQWSFTAEGPPRLNTTVPADGAIAVPRYGQLVIDFNRRPTVDPVITLEPGAMLRPGFWSGTTWTVPYADLQPLTRYSAEVTLATADPKGHIHRTWAFMTEPGAPPAGVPVIWYSTSDPRQPPPPGLPNRLVAVDWTGTMVGTLYAPSVGQQSPDGAWLSLQETVGVLSAGGQIVSGHSLNGLVWSDRSGRYCDVGFTPSTRQQWLEAGVIGGTSHVVAQLGAAQAGFFPLACSSLADRAVLGDQGMGGFLDLRVIELSSGRLLYRHAYSGNQRVMLLSSRDGRYVAESTSAYGGQTVTVIRQTSDGAIVARLGAQRVVAFSWDGSLVVAAPVWGSPGPNEARLLDWRHGTVLWRVSGSPQTTGQSITVLPEPNGPALIVGMGNPSNNGDLENLVLVHPDGRAETIVTGPVFVAAYPG